MENPSPNYKPALAYDWLTSLYDPVMRWTMRERTFKFRLIEQAAIQPHDKVLDLGCGTATLTMLIKQGHPDSSVLGLDGDEKALQIGRQKLAQAGLDVSLHHGMSFQLPYGDESLDRVVSSLLFHHLTRQDKVRTLHEVRRVLRSGGELHIADWGQARNMVMRTAFFLLQLLDGFDTTKDNIQGLLPELLVDAGFDRVRETGQFATVFGPLSLYAARKP